MIGLAVVFGGSRPVKAVAAIFALIGIWIGTTDAGKQIITGFNELARLVG